jgi:hypothetical protein
MDNRIISECSKLSCCPLRVHNLTLLVKYPLKIQWENLAIPIARHGKPIQRKEEFMNSVAANIIFPYSFLIILLVCLSTAPEIQLKHVTLQNSFTHASYKHFHIYHQSLLP